MAKFTTYAEVLTPDHVTWKAYTAGIVKNPPGVPLKEILKRTGGVYENKLAFNDDFREQLRKVAELTGDSELMRLSQLDGVTISLEHLRPVDPETRIVNGYDLSYTTEESDRLGLTGNEPSDPKNTIVVNVDPDNPLHVERY